MIDLRKGKVDLSNLLGLNSTQLNSMYSLDWDSAGYLTSPNDVTLESMSLNIFRDIV